MIDNWKYPDDRFPMMGTGYPCVGEQRLTLPLEFVMVHEAGARSNHGQSVNRLKERGGLGWKELAGIIAGFKYGERNWPLDMAHEYVMRALFVWQQRQPVAEAVQQTSKGSAPTNPTKEG